ncbi:MAG: hypothetical protein LQ352_008053, partial [Teloschistes flavicans]
MSIDNVVQTYDLKAPDRTMIIMPLFHVHGLLAQGKEVRIITLGKKGRDALRRLFPDRIAGTYDFSASKTLSLDSVKPVADQILAL